VKGVEKVEPSSSSLRYHRRPHRFRRVSEILFLNVLLAVIVGETRKIFVERDHGPSAESAASFHTTRWTIVVRAAQGGQSALAELCRLYWNPLDIFARRRGYTPDDAQDLTRGFFLHAAEHRTLTGVDRLKGKFRSFLGWRTVPDPAEID
jgi:hypothetical protein